jgi:hypothetical protein
MEQVKAFSHIQLLANYRSEAPLYFYTQQRSRNPCALLWSRGQISEAVGGSV